MYHTNDPGGEGVLFEGLSCSHRDWLVPSGDRSVTVEQIVSAKTVQHGQVASSETSVETRNLGNIGFKEKSSPFFNIQMIG